MIPPRRRDPPPRAARYLNRVRPPDKSAPATISAALSSCRHPALLAALAFIAACNTRPPSAPLGLDAGPPPVCERPGTTCIRDVAWECDERGPTGSPVDCAAEGLRCAEGFGCRACVPGQVQCAGETVQVCDPDGSGYATGETCDPAAGERCSAEGCADLCAQAAEERSYIGCSYWPVTTSNSQIAPEFEFALAIANPNLVPALVIVERGASEAARVTVGPGALEVLPLPTLAALHRAGTQSARMLDGAYHVVSDVPVVVTQFNPLEYRLARDCDELRDPTRDDACFSFTNDASLLLPDTVLTGSYVVASRPTFMVAQDGTPLGGSGFAALVGIDEEPMPIEIVSSAHIAASADGSFAAMAPGESRTLTLARGEVLQLATLVPETCPGTVETETISGTTLSYCDAGTDYDLTGTIIRSNGRVAVIAGHDCSFVPFNRWACDHLEEQLIPVESLGTSVLVGAPQPVRREPSLVRIVSAADGNVVTLQPLGEEVLLERGEYYELEITADVRVEGTGPVLVAQFLVGQDYFGLGTGASGNGDPAMGLAVPEAQYRSSYAVLTPSTYERSYIGVIAPTDLRVVLDDGVVTGWTVIEGTGFSSARVRVEGGVHRLDAALPFGVSVYGFGRYTSYLVSGGLDLRRIGPPI